MESNIKDKFKLVQDSNKAGFCTKCCFYRKNKDCLKVMSQEGVLLQELDEELGDCEHGHYERVKDGIHDK